MKNFDVTIFTDTETEEITVSSPGFDDFSTFDETEAEHEADNMLTQLRQAGLSARIVRT